jgi:ATP-binding cassette, subfamily F, member 3
MVRFHFSSRHELTIDDLDKPVNLSFPNPEPMRFPGALISANKISFTYPGSTKKVLDDITLTIHPGARVGFVGKNGEGKSTLIKLLIGTLGPQSGSVERHSRLRLGYFDQHSVEILSAPEVKTSSAYEYFVAQLKEKHAITVDEQTGRSFLGSFGIRGHIATNPISTLSGGQKVCAHISPLSGSDSIQGTHGLGSPCSCLGSLPCS